MFLAPSCSSEIKTRLGCQHCALFPPAKPEAGRLTPNPAHSPDLGPAAPPPTLAHPLRHMPVDVTSSVLLPLNMCLIVGVVLDLPCLP